MAFLLFLGFCGWLVVTADQARNVARGLHGAWLGLASACLLGVAEGVFALSIFTGWPDPRLEATGYLIAGALVVALAAGAVELVRGRSIRLERIFQ